MVFTPDEKEAIYRVLKEEVWEHLSGEEKLIILKPYDEQVLADMLGVKKSTVKKKRYRIRQRLKRWINKTEGVHQGPKPWYN